MGNKKKINKNHVRNKTQLDLVNDKILCEGKKKNIVRISSIRLLLFRL